MTLVVFSSRATGGVLSSTVPCFAYLSDVTGGAVVVVDVVGSRSRRVKSIPHMSVASVPVRVAADTGRRGQEVFIRTGVAGLAIEGNKVNAVLQVCVLFSEQAISFLQPQYVFRQIGKGGKEKGGTDRGVIWALMGDC